MATANEIGPLSRPASTKTKAASSCTFRRAVPRREHAHVGNIQRDPVALLKLSSAGRIEKLVPLRYGRMIQSPFAFFRGSAIIQAHDLAGTPNSGLHTQICGDCHLANFGGFATPERTLIFDVNDFDETSPGPWEWDLKRVVASFVVAARHLGHKRGVSEEIVRRVVASYQTRMSQYAQMSVLDTWYDRISFERLLAESASPESRKRIRRAMEKAADRTSAALLPKLSEQVNGRWIIRDAPPVLFHGDGAASLLSKEDRWEGAARESALHEAFESYLSTLAPDRRHLLGYFTGHDSAYKVVGVGSVGTRCLVYLLIDRNGKPLFLQIKEAVQSVVARYFGGSGVEHEGRRVVEGQRLMQAASDMFLGWTKGPRGRHFYVRQLRDMKFSAQIELMDAELLCAYGSLCGWVLARAHAKASGDAGCISAYIGTSDRFADAVATYAEAYADQVERDYEIFVKACRSGKLEARSEEDMAADFRP